MRQTVSQLEQQCDKADGCRSLLNPRGSAVNEASRIRKNPCNEGTAHLIQITHTPTMTLQCLNSPTLTVGTEAVRQCVS